MEENLDIEAAKAALEKQLNELKNVEYADWDNLVINICNGDISRGSIRMMRQDMDAMANLQGVNRSEVIEMMIQALEEEAISQKND